MSCSRPASADEFPRSGIALPKAAPVTLEIAAHVYVLSRALPVSVVCLSYSVPSAQIQGLK